MVIYPMNIEPNPPGSLARPISSDSRSAPDSCLPMPAQSPLSPLELTLTRNSPVSPLKLTLTKSGVFKSHRITLLQKIAGGSTASQTLRTNGPSDSGDSSYCTLPLLHSFTPDPPALTTSSMRYTHPLSVRGISECLSSCSLTPPRTRFAPSACALKAWASRPTPFPARSAPPSASPATRALSTSESSSPCPAWSSASRSASLTNWSAATPRKKTPSCASPHPEATSSSAENISPWSPAPAPWSPKSNVWPSPSAWPRPAAACFAAAPTSPALPRTVFKD